MGGAQLPQDELLIFSSAEEDAKEYFGDSGFVPDFVFVVTWEELVQWGSTASAGVSTFFSTAFSF